MTPPPSSHIDRYTIEHPLAPGATGLVFAGRQQLPEVDGERRVALKMVKPKYIDQARKEAAKLLSLDQIQGVVNILDYIETEASVLPEKQRNNALVKHVFTEDDMQEKAGILVLQYIAGAPLVRRIAPHNPDSMVPGKDYFVVRDRETGSWYQEELRYAWTPAEKMEIMIQIVRHIEACHRENTFHGDLKPLNILYNDTRKEVHIVDFQEGVSGSPGWQAPEHLTDQIPGPEVDIFIIGVFLTRFFPEANIKRLRKLAERCLQAEPQKRPSAKEVLDALLRVQWEQSHPRLGRYGLPMAALAALLFFGMAWALFLSHKPETLADRFDKDKGARYIEQVTKIKHAEQVADAAAELKSLLDQNSDARWDLEFRDNLIAGLGKLGGLSPSNHLAEIPKTMPAVTCLWHEPYGRDFFLWRGSWIRQGSYMAEGHYFRGFTVPQTRSDFLLRNCPQIEFAGPNGDVKLANPSFSWLPGQGDWTFNQANKIFSNGVSLPLLASRIADRLGLELVNLDPSADRIPVMGVISFETIDDLKEILFEVFPFEVEGNKLFLMPSLNRRYDFSNFEQVEYERAYLLQEFAFMTRRACLTLDPASSQRLKDKRITLHMDRRKTTVPWQVIIGRGLKPYDLEFYVAANRVVYIIDKIND